MTAAADVRTRVITWEDPAAGHRAAQALGGLEYLQGMARGDYPLPPMARLLGIDGMEVERGRVVMSIVPGECHYNPMGVAHGGLAATLFDSVMGCAVQTTLPAGTGYTTLELKVNFTRAMTNATGRVRCIGTVIHAGSRVATAEGRLVDEAGKLYGHATTTCLILPANGAPPAR
jgi:uncharacterized protein (TIGR00369 family)